ncbi:outer membrane lipoprotein carrier protein LolA [Thermodesulfovibrio sp. 3907-1M]|uniref:Outer membrane lipoprotein carrier protein LolA n=1 Tax=Thermodesulfovibrio autotrophicus TaxID=3118333 RepID=A0AAU8GYA5_9BACT
MKTFAVLKILAINLLIVFFLFSFCYAQTALLKLENAYKNINDAAGSFIQTSHIKEINKVQQFRGRFFIKGDKVRWQYTGEFSQTIYLDNKTLIIYDKKRKQAIMSEFSEEKYGQLPLALLRRMADLKKDFEVNEKSENTIMLIPRSKMGNIKSIEITVAEGDFPIKSMKLIDMLSNTVKIDFSDVKINTSLKNSLFKFTPKKDDTVLKY